ncbi:hypothetical protein IF1G_06839 [Cordyceps javanica]|uniref:Uncharacterized protein n=1 Tax=Cordyceps javanica TaxID=43265 RepID=A0A545VYA3_9HYPO|nr:hypothetical protein IF1G_06839 [Cordyceps javanica]TQW06698.1 acetyltransferase (GNAT) family domain-containing protein [Cordyceps javanica]
MNGREIDTALPAGLLFFHAADKVTAWHKALNDPNNELFAWTYTDLVSLVGIPMWRELHLDAELIKYQRLVIHEGTGEIVALAYCVPFFCPRLAAVLARSAAPNNNNTPPPLDQLVSDWATPALPDGGWGTLLFRGVMQAFARQGKPPQARHAPWTEEQARELAGVASLPDPPNALCGIFVAVKHEYRRQGVSEALLVNFKAIARQNRLAVTAVPVHLTKRRQYLDGSFDEYYRWSKGNPYRPEMSWLQGDRRRWENGEPMMPLDPWLRKHFELGAQLVKVAPRTLDISLPAATWLPFMREKYKNAGENSQNTIFDENPDLWQEGTLVDGSKLDGVRPGPEFPVKLRWDAARELLVYEDGDIWVLHSVY